MGEPGLIMVLQQYTVVKPEGDTVYPYRSSDNDCFQQDYPFEMTGDFELNGKMIHLVSASKTAGCKALGYKPVMSADGSGLPAGTKNNGHTLQTYFKIVTHSLF